MKANIGIVKRIMISSVVSILLTSGCGFVSEEHVESNPTVTVYDLGPSIVYTDYELAEKEDSYVFQPTDYSLIADASMDIENKFFSWAADNAKGLVNMRISFFRSDFYGFPSDNTDSSVRETPESDGQDLSWAIIPDFDASKATKYVTAKGNTYYIMGQSLFDADGNFKSAISYDYGKTMTEYAEWWDNLDFSSDVGKDYYEEIDGIMHHFYWTDDQGLLNEWTDENGRHHIQGFH